MLKPVHNCGICAAAGTVPEALLWTLDIPAEARCRPICADAAEPVSLCQLRAEYRVLLLNPEHRGLTHKQYAELLNVTPQDFRRMLNHKEPS